jgi:hypothetical protein
MGLEDRDNMALCEEAQYALANVLMGIELTTLEMTAITTVQEILDDLIVTLDEEM